MTKIKNPYKYEFVKSVVDYLNLSCIEIKNNFYYELKFKKYKYTDDKINKIILKRYNEGYRLNDFKYLIDVIIEYRTETAILETVDLNYIFNPLIIFNRWHFENIEIINDWNR